MAQSNTYGTIDIFKDMSCTECGEVPPYEKNLTISGVEVKVSYKNWKVTYKLDSVDHSKPILCPLCLRRLKIEKIKQSL